MDRRERNHQWFSRFDESRMLLIVEEHTDEDGEVGDLEIPAVFEVCETCEGKGKHVNPAIDSHGITRDEFDDDPDFERDYRRGVYDVGCSECKGRRVVPVVDETRATKAQVATAVSLQNDLIDYQETCAAERRMGA